VISYQNQLLELYLEQNQVGKAQEIYDSLPDKEPKGGRDMDGIILAVRTNRLQALIDAWRANPDSVPKDSFGSAIYRLMKPTLAYKPDFAAIRPLQEFIFEYKRQNHSLVPTDFLALAQLRLDTGDLPGTLDLLRQLTLQPISSHENGTMTFPIPGQPEFQPGQPTSINYSPSGEAPNPYVDTDYAASLLEHNHHPAEAIPFLQSLVKSVPWDASYRFRLAQAQLASKARDRAYSNLIAVASDASAPYNLRVQASRTLATFTAQPTELGSRELDFVAHPSTAAAVRQPYAAEARIAAAALASTVASERELLLREAIAINPASPNARRACLDLLLLQPATADPSATLAILRSLANYPTAISASDSDAEPDSANDAASNEPATPARGAAIDSPDNVVVPAVSLPLGTGDLDLRTRIHLAAQLASVNERDGNLESAFAYADLAASLAKNLPQPELTRRRDDLKTAILIARRNSLRRPNLHASLDQSNQVRPHLTASTVYQKESQ
jgi:hypothetical protein